MLGDVVVFVLVDCIIVSHFKRIIHNMLPRRVLVIVILLLLVFIKLGTEMDCSIFVCCF